MTTSFDNPPVVETVLSVQFEELESFRNIHFGLFHTEVRDAFPRSEDRPRLEKIFESFPLVPKLKRLQFQQAGGEPDRVWYCAEGANPLMLQLQPDRFALNWCKRDGQQYPTYRSYRPEFLERLDQFSRFVDRSAIGTVTPTVCEVSYVNHILPKPGESVSEAFSAVFSGIDWVSSDGWLIQPPESISLNRTFPIESTRGRLYVEAGSAHDGQRDILSLKITARTLCSNLNSVPNDLDLAHTWVVKSFVSLTRASARTERWGEKS